MNIESIGADKSLSLAELNRLLAQNEDILGPLAAIGNDGARTVLSFDTDKDPPGKHAAIAANTAGQPSVPAGATKICEGIVFIAGVLTASSASR